MAQRSDAIFDATKLYSPLSVPAENTALFLMDYQNLTMGFTGEEAPRILETATKLRDWAQSKGIVTYHCLIDIMTQKPDPHMKMAERLHLYKDKINASPDLANEAEQLAIPQDTKLEKTVSRQVGLVSALESKGLREDLKSRGIRSIIMCGISTSGCVFSSVRAGTDQGFIVTVAEDACFDPAPGLHDLLAKHALSATAHVATVQEIQTAMG